MEVNHLNTTIPFSAPVHIDDRMISRKADLEMCGAGRPKFEFEQVMMDIEDVKNFLYMVLSGRGINLIQDADLGKNVNKYA
jgi:hypothetical protein